jgi:hypothetical protein
MLVIFERIANRLKPYQVLGYFLMFVSIVFFILPGVFPDIVQFSFLYANNEYGRLGLLSCLWILLLNISVMVFNDLPQRDISNITFFKRWAYKVQRFFYSILAILFIILTLAILLLTVRFLRV